MNLTLIISIIVALVVGNIFGYALRQIRTTKKVATAEAEAEKRIAASKTKEQEVLAKAKEKALAILDEAKKEEKVLRVEVIETQKRLEKREELFDQKLLEMDKKQEAIDKQKEEIEVRKERIREVKTQIEELKAQEAAKLEEVAGLTREAAIERLEKMVQEDYEEALQSRLRKMEAATEEELEAKARQILSLAVTRFASSVSVETTTTQVELPSDEMKGRVIGKEGRNIKAIEHLTGTEIIVDETPNMITISCFSPIRRQVAKIALEDLIKDGRIHPARIEDAIKTAKTNLAKEIRKAMRHERIEKTNKQPTTDNQPPQTAEIKS